MKDALDLSPLDAALRHLGDSVTGHSALEIMEEAGQIIQSQWRDNIANEGLVDTGRYLESIFVEVLHGPDERGVWLVVATDAANPKTRIPYPIMLEYGTADMPGRPVGMRAFDTSRRKIVKGVGSAVERKVRSRARR